MVVLDTGGNACATAHRCGVSIRTGSLHRRHRKVKLSGHGLTVESFARGTEPLRRVRFKKVLINTPFACEALAKCTALKSVQCTPEIIKPWVTFESQQRVDVLNRHLRLHE